MVTEFHRRRKASMTRFSRRSFVKAGAAASVFPWLSRRAQAARPAAARGERLRLAFIGAGGRADANLGGLAGAHEVAALCDVDEARAAANFQKFPAARRFTDFRRMLDAMEKEIDAVVVSTPDHTHAVAAMNAIRRGKHVYCEKPLAHSIGEVRALMKAAQEHKVVTQLGNQGHSTESIRVFCEWIRAGVIGPVRTIHAGCSSLNSAIPSLPRLAEKPPVPAGLDWDLWLGPAAARPYHPSYLPGRWRGWVPFGNGTLGDWVCHVVDPVFWALDLGAPKTIRAEVKDYDPKTQGDAYPFGETVTFEFAARGPRGPVTLVWHSGSSHIPRPRELEEDRKPVDTGALVYGEKGTIMYGSHGAGGVRLIPEARMLEFTQRPAATIPRVAGGHHQDWVDAIRNGRKAGSDFSYGGPLTEIALLGIIAVKRAGQTLEWDGPSGRFTNSPEANALLNPPLRPGWSL
jgi:predicted dehydrogenase